MGIRSSHFSHTSNGGQETELEGDAPSSTGPRFSAGSNAFGGGLGVGGGGTPMGTWPPTAVTYQARR